MLPRFTEYCFADPASVAEALAASVAAQLREATASRGRAVIAVSGGSTPKAFLRRLGVLPLEWERVVVTLCDERWVPESSPRSNARLVGETLLQGPASAARFVPLHADTPDPESAAGEIERRVALLPLPLDVVVLGLGSDGHTASLFPDGDHLAAALDPHSAAHALPMRAPAACEPRVTLTLPVLAEARRAYLLIEGPEKKDVFEQIVRGEAAFAGSPLRAVMEHLQAPLAVYWCA